MAGHDMPPQFIAQLERRFEVERRATAHRPATVRLVVSPEMSTANHESPATPPLSTTVRHTPEQAIEAPMATPAGSKGR
jgi:hypothetical protein